MAQLEKINVQKDKEIIDLNLELNTLKKIQRSHIKTITVSDDDYYLNEVVFNRKNLTFFQIKDLKMKKQLILSKLEHIKTEQEKYKTLFSKKKEKIQKMEIELKDKEGNIPQLSAKHISKAQLSDFEKLKEKVKGLKNITNASEKIQMRDLKRLEKQLKSLKKENMLLDEELSTKIQVF